MKLTLDNPMAKLRAAKKLVVNTNFASAAQSTLHTDMVYTQKRMWAMTNSQSLKPEADLRGITVEELAALILSKPDTLAAREMIRQDVMKQIDAAQTPEDLNAVRGKV